MTYVPYTWLVGIGHIQGSEFYVTEGKTLLKWSVGIFVMLYFAGLCYLFVVSTLQGPFAIVI